MPHAAFCNMQRSQTTICQRSSQHVGIPAAAFPRHRSTAGAQRLRCQATRHNNAEWGTFLRNNDNRRPDLNDEQWPSKVTDWSEFWYDTEWELAADDTDFDDEHDASVEVESAVSRAANLIKQIKTLPKRADAINVLQFPSLKDKPSEKFASEEAPDPVRYGL